MTDFEPKNTLQIRSKALFKALKAIKNLGAGKTYTKKSKISEIFKINRLNACKHLHDYPPLRF